MSECYKIKFYQNSKNTVPCRIAKGWNREGRLGQYFGRIVVGDMEWAIVLWDGEEDPDVYKAAALEIATRSPWAKI